MSSKTSTSTTPSAVYGCSYGGVVVEIRFVAETGVVGVSGGVGGVRSSSVEPVGCLRFHSCTNWSVVDT